MLIYLITDRRLRPDLTLPRLVEQAAASGADMLQIREKDLDALLLLDCVRRAMAAARGTGAAVFVNGRADVALSAGAAGVHLPAAGLPAAEVKQRWGQRLRVGVSTHGAGEARQAAQAGADFITCGPVFDTPSKRAYGPPLGAAALRSVAAAGGPPVFAIGGIDESSIGRLKDIPLAGVAVVSAVLRADDMAAAVTRLREAAA